MAQKRWFGRIKITLWFLNAALVAATIFALFSFFALSKTVTEVQYSQTWRVNLLIMQLGFIAVIFTFLITILLILHRTIGPLPRLEKVLDEIINGNYSLRLNVRKKDIMGSFVEKLNKVLDLLEKKAKS